MFAWLVLGMLMWLPAAACVFYISISAIRHHADKLLHSRVIDLKLLLLALLNTLTLKISAKKSAQNTTNTLIFDVNHEVRHMTINPCSLGSTFLPANKS